MWKIINFVETRPKRRGEHKIHRIRDVMGEWPDCQPLGYEDDYGFYIPDFSGGSDSEVSEAYEASEASEYMDDSDV